MAIPTQTRAGTLNFRGDDPVIVGGWDCADDGCISMNLPDALVA